MEHEWNFQLSKKIVVLLLSMVLLLGLLFVSSKVNPRVDLLIPDDGLRGAVREKLDNENGAIYRRDVMQITSLDASSREIASLEGIQYFKRLVTLNLANNQVQDLSLLSRLPLLSELNLRNNKITDLEYVNFDQLTHLPLRVLDLSENFVFTDENMYYLDMIGEFEELKELSLGGSQLKDFSKLTQLEELKRLELNNCGIQDVSGLLELVQLEELNLRENFIMDIRPVSNFSHLTYLNIHSNPIEVGLDTLSKLSALETLIMRNVAIGENHEFLRSLTQLEELNIRNTSITDLSSVVALMEGGALQDIPEEGINARVDLLELDFPSAQKNPYVDLYPFWANISIRYPLSLPYYPGSIEAPKFSHPSGFYEQGFNLVLSTSSNDAQIYYTLDGSEPSPWTIAAEGSSTFLYIEPLLIQDRTQEDNYLSMIPTTDDAAHVLPQENVFKGTVIRAMVMDVEGNFSDVETHSYFVNEDIFERYTFPVVSLVTDERSLFDPELGIYVPGLVNNYSQRGLKWERPAQIEMFSPSGLYEFSTALGLRIHGQFTRRAPQKSLRLTGRKIYSSDGVINYDFFPELDYRVQDHSVETFQTLLLRSGSGEIRNTYLRDELAHSILLPTRLDVQGYQPIILFINGEYWGIHMFRSRYDEHYFSGYYDIPVEDIAIMESNSTLKYGEEEDRRQYLSILEMADTNYTSHGFPTVDAFADPDVYQTVTEMIDIENYIDYYTAQIYFANEDWPGNNVLFWRKSVDPLSVVTDEPYGHDGKWRWAIWDVDWGFENPSQNTLYEATRPDGDKWFNAPWATFLVRLLLENDDFQLLFINRFADHLNTIYREDVVYEKAEQIEALYAPEIEEHLQRWGGSFLQVSSFDHWQNNVNAIKSFALERPINQREHIIQKFDLTGIYELTVQSDASQGYVQVNSIDVLEGTVGVDDPENWTGIYFQDVPIQISAIPAEGYRFSHWEGLGVDSYDSFSQQIMITSEVDLVLRAIFIED